MSLSSTLRSRRRRGLTLMELVVVLTILAALASILVPLFPNILRRTHKATDATQTSEVSKAVQLYQALFLSYPDNFDLLVDSAGATPAYLPGATSTAGVFGGFTITGNLTAAELSALQNVGVNFVQPLATDATPAGFQATMYPYSAAYTANQTTLGTGTTVRLLASNATIDGFNPAFLATERATDPTARYIVFGVGARNSMVGQVMQDAPMSAPQKKDFTPATTYSRVGVIFKISGTEVVNSERARFIAAVALEDDELESTEKDVVGYYQVAKDPRLP